ncbi:MAG: adenosylcobinamide kinase / adenosylcobinamide-phosphate guanylyltransferase [Frankiales bacterium]|jgi:adenosylcobinamide kinase/adenosylcobinamide-phosphate guanylyltransferase|nr:adenosylcobinamide kinase / adenosylcobinamide-phosphate guanylyltransferase [Frankiales bacterium]
MEVLLLGTGASDGWPNPFCTCSSCQWARTAGVVRGQTAALVDNTLLLDCGPEAPRAAVRLGRDFTEVRHMLLTHAHSDHIGPNLLEWRRWARRTEPMDVVGPPAVIALCQAWVDRDDRSLRWHEVHAGDRLTVGSYDVRVIEASHDLAFGPPVLYDLTDAEGRRVLWGQDTGPLTDGAIAAMRGAAYDVVFLEETAGDATLDGHLNLTSWPLTVAELRRVGAVTDATRLVAIHLGCQNPPLPDLARRLAVWNAEALPDGAVVTVGESQASRQPTPRRVLILGGARSGKSHEAERRLLAEPDVTYVATARSVPDDSEWTARIEKHRARRPAHWRTVETHDLVAVLSQPGPLLIDCITLWIAALVDADADAQSATDALVGAWRDTSAHVVAVSNEVGSGVVPASATGREFRDELGALNARLAAEADEVWLVTAGVAQRLR